jgi:hypothetical protein
MILRRKVPKYAAGSATGHAGRNYRFKTADSVDYDASKSIFGDTDITANVTCDAVSGKCAGYLENVYNQAGVDLGASGIKGDAWNLSHNIEAAGGSLIYNALDDSSVVNYLGDFVQKAKDDLWDRKITGFMDTVYGVLPESFVREFGGSGRNAAGSYGGAQWYKKAMTGNINTSDLKRLLYKANKDKEETLFKNLKIGDVVGAFVGGTKYGLRALLDPMIEDKDRAGKATFATHVGYVSGFDSDGNPIITHNINGHVAHEVLIPGDNKRQFFVTWAARPALRTRANGGQPDFSAAEKITEKVQEDTKAAAESVVSAEDVNAKIEDTDDVLQDNFDGIYNGDAGDPYTYATKDGKYFFKKRGQNHWTEATHDVAIEAIGEVVAKKQVKGLNDIVFEGERGDPYLYKYEGDKFKFRKRGEADWEDAKDPRAIAAIRDVLLKGKRFQPTKQII